MDYYGRPTETNEKYLCLGISYFSEGFIPIGFNCVFKTKKYFKEKIEQYKVGLVVKGFMQRACINCKPFHMFKGFL